MLITTPLVAPAAVASLFCAFVSDATHERTALCAHDKSVLHGYSFFVVITVNLRASRVESTKKTGNMRELMTESIVDV